MPDDPTPPWRLIDADPEPSRAGVPAPAPTARPSIDPGLLRTLGVVALAAVLAIAAFALALGAGSGDGVVIEGTSATGSDGAPGPASLAAGGGTVVVEVAGAVAEPGLFRVPAGSRVGELIVLAGGYGPRVDVVRVDAELNLAATVADGDRIRVPSRDDPTDAAGASAPAGGPDTSGAGDLIDLNTATLEQLDTLPGIGPVTAEKIIAARDEAPFAAVDELRSRGLLGEKTFDQVRALVTVG